MKEATNDDVVQAIEGLYDVLCDLKAAVETMHRDLAGKLDGVQAAVWDTAP